MLSNEMNVRMYEFMNAKNRMRLDTVAHKPASNRQVKGVEMTYVE